MGDLVVGRQPRRAAADQRPRGAQFVGESAGVGAHGGIGDQPPCGSPRVGTEGRQPADDPVQGEPMQDRLLLHAS